MFQAIVTKYLGPTNFRGARIKATADAGSIIIPWEHGQSTEENHRLAASVLLAKYGWDKHYSFVTGGLPQNNGMAHVMLREERAQ